LHLGAHRQGGRAPRGGGRHRLGRLLGKASTPSPVAPRALFFSGQRLKLVSVPGPSTPRDDEHGPVRIGRRRFRRAGLAATGAAFIPPAATAGSRSLFAGPSGAAAASSIPQLPLRALYPHLPAVPLDAEGAAETLLRLAIRTQQVIQAKQGLTREF